MYRHFKSTYHKKQKNALTNTKTAGNGIPITLSVLQCQLQPNAKLSSSVHVSVGVCVLA